MIKGRWSTIRAFSLRDWWTLGQAWLLLLTVDLGLRLLPFRWMQRFVTLSMRRAREQGEASLVVIQRTERVVNLAAQYHLCPMRCLPRALVLQWLLGRQ
ncbi:MAG: lasso peptide biosynthesis B2 protein, partial [Anaerolineae bacterium]